MDKLDPEPRHLQEKKKQTEQTTLTRTEINGFII